MKMRGDYSDAPDAGFVCCRIFDVANLLVW